MKGRKEGRKEGRKRGNEAMSYQPWVKHTFGPPGSHVLGQRVIEEAAGFFFQ
jgi:hypothetical protein